MYATKPATDTQLIVVSPLRQPYNVATRPGTFNIYLFESPCLKSETCRLAHEQDGCTPHFPAMTGYHIALRDELIFILGCEHIAPFKLCEARGNQLVISAACALFEKLVAIMQKIPPVCKSDEASLKIKMLSLAKLLIVHIARHHLKFQDTPSARQPRHEDLTMRFIQLINRGNYERRSVFEYARLLSVSRGILDQALQTTTGYTANRLIQRTLVYKAKQAAINSNAPMKETAYNLGFNDIAHFSKFFRQNAGMTFSTFKQTFQNV